LGKKSKAKQSMYTDDFALDLPLNFRLKTSAKPSVHLNPFECGNANDVKDTYIALETCVLHFICPRTEHVRTIAQIVKRLQEAEKASAQKKAAEEASAAEKKDANILQVLHKSPTIAIKVVQRLSAQSPSEEEEEVKSQHQRYRGHGGRWSSQPAVIRRIQFNKKRKQKPYDRKQSQQKAASVLV
jgi:hypothetical protein